jgi:tetratricopeptide (TPR) repeat protein
MYRQSIITTLLIILTTSCFAQNVDSLILAAENLKGKSKSAAYEKIGLEFYQQDFTIKAKEYFNKSLEVSKEVDDTLGQMNALKGLLRVAYHKEDSVELSREYAGHLEELSVDSGNKLMQAYVLHHKGRANKEDFELSINRMKRALDIYEATGVKESTNIVYRELGEALLDTAPTEAFMYFQKNLELAEELNYPEEIYLARSNISSALISMKQYEDARNFCERNIEIAKEANNQDFLAYNYLLIGISYKNEKNYSKAIEYAMQGKEICEENDLMDKKQYTYQLLKEIYNERGNYTEAFQFFAKEKQIEAALEKEKTVNKLAAINAQFELEKRNRSF